MADVLQLIEREQVAPSAPIAQRRPSSSPAPMFPAHSESPTDVHSCVGTITHLQTGDPNIRQEITVAFMDFVQSREEELMPQHNTTWHWGKLEPGEDTERLAQVQEYVQQRYDVRRLNHVWHMLDPQSNVGSKWLNAVLPLTSGA